MRGLPDESEGGVWLPSSYAPKALRHLSFHSLGTAGPIQAIPLVEARGLKGTLTEQGAAVIQAVASSQVTPEQAAKLLQALAAQAKIEEADRLEKRICELEKTVGV